MGAVDNLIERPAPKWIIFFFLLLILCSLLCAEGLDLDLKELGIISMTVSFKIGNIMPNLFISPSTTYKHINIDKPILEN